RGMFFDGNEIYGIEPAKDVAEAAVQPLAASGNAPVVFRLADVLVPSAGEFCATEMTAEAGEAPTALDLYESVAAEFSSIQLHDHPSRRIRVAIVADTEFAHAFESRGISAEEAIVARMNIVDGIFSRQLGVKVELAHTTVFRDGPDPFTQSKAVDLLDELRRYRRNSPTQRSMGLTHLMTGRDLNGETVGIAYMGSVCDTSNAASLSEGTRSTTAAALIVAHEMGHNFNAPHDGESGACAAVPHSFIMAPRLNGSEQFSACSITQMQPTIARASCLTNFMPPDAGLELTTHSMQREVDSPFTVSFAVRAMGEEPSAAVTTTVTLPTGLELRAATISGGACTSGAGTVVCEAGTLRPGEARAIDLDLSGSVTGSYAISVSVSSSNDSAPGNNSGAVTVALVAPGTPAPLTETPSNVGASDTAEQGGGGRLDLLLLALLALAAAYRAARPMLTQRQPADPSRLRACRGERALR
ncbi:MAG TPA: M12 family metallo-peptidase, partial [Steroidobacteraceae bacterium]